VVPKAVINQRQEYGQQGLEAQRTQVHRGVFHADKFTSTGVGMGRGADFNRVGAGRRLGLERPGPRPDPARTPAMRPAAAPATLGSTWHHGTSPRALAAAFAGDRLHEIRSQLCRYHREP
jgi:hypothetical protein